MKKFVFTFLAAAFLSSPALVASPSYYLQAKGKSTLDATNLAAALSTVGLQIQTLSGTASNGAAVFTFPIVGGGIDAGTLVFEAVHTGGFTLTDGTDTVTLNSPIINTTGTQPVLTMLATEDGNLLGRFVVGNIQVPTLTETVTSGSKVKLKHLAVTLSAAAAEMLNEAYPSAGFAEGQPIATVTVKMFAGNQLP